MWARLRKKFLWQRPSLIYFVTGGCEGQCVHCFAHDLTTEDELSVEEARNFAIALGPIEDLSISGGEPLLRDDLVELISPFFEIGQPKTCTFPTGGHRPDQAFSVVGEIAQRYPRTKLTVALPLEGDEKLHNQIRGLDDAFYRLKSTYEALIPLIETGAAEVKLNTTLSSFNQLAVKSIIETAKREFPKAVFHHFEFMRGEGRDEACKPPDPDLIQQHREIIFDHLKTYKQFFNYANRLAVAAKKKVFDVELDVLRGKPLPFVCRAHEMGLVLYPNGDLAFCEQTAIIGNIRRQSLEAILNGAPARVAIIDIVHRCACTHSCFLPKSLMASPLTALDVIRSAASMKKPE